MPEVLKVGQVRTDGLISLQIVAVAAKWDIADTVVILEKVLDSDDSHVVSEITSNPPIGRVNVEMTTDGEKALQTWMERAFGVNIF